MLRTVILSTLFSPKIEGRFKSNTVQRVDDALDPFSNNRHPLPVNANVGNIRHLFYANDDIHKNQTTILSFFTFAFILYPFSFVLQERSAL